jgi:hypothetical protein
VDSLGARHWLDPKRRWSHQRQYFGTSLPVKQRHRQRHVFFRAFVPTVMNTVVSCETGFQSIGSSEAALSSETYFLQSVRSYSHEYCGLIGDSFSEHHFQWSSVIVRDIFSSERSFLQSWILWSHGRQVFRASVPVKKRYHQRYIFFRAFVRTVMNTVVSSETGFRSIDSNKVASLLRHMFSRASTSTIVKYFVNELPSLVKYNELMKQWIKAFQKKRALKEIKYSVIYN